MKGPALRVGIITFHCAYNFGSALQTYALQRAISSLGNECYVIDYRSRDYYKYHLFHFKHPVVMLRDIIHFSRNYKRRKAFISFWRSSLNMTEQTYSYRNDSELSELSSRFDAFVCGSDQIWNLDCTGGVVEPFFLSFAGDKRRIAYAPSLAHTSFRPEHFDREKVSALLNKFDCLSIREEETAPLFQPLVDKRIKITLDPTLLFDSAEYDSMLLSAPQEDYIFVYLLRQCSELVEHARKLAESSGKKVYYVSDQPLGIRNATNCFGIGPAEFVALVAHASVVLTNSFHATVFSILYRRNFKSFALDASGARMRDLLEKLGINERLNDPFAPVDWDSLQNRLDILRNSSWDYLREALA